MKKIEVRIESKYGTEYMFPVCEMAKMLCEITNRKTINPSVVEILKRYGYEITSVR